MRCLFRRKPSGSARPARPNRTRAARFVGPGGTFRQRIRGGASPLGGRTFRSDMKSQREALSNALSLPQQVFGSHSLRATISEPPDVAHSDLNRNVVCSCINRLPLFAVYSIP